MTIEMIGVIAIAAATATSMLYKKKFNKKGSKKNQFIESAKKKGCVTQGVAVSSKFQAGIRGHSNPTLRADSRTVKYEYRVDGKVYHKEMTFQSPGLTHVRYPDAVTVYYDRSNPRKAICPEEATKAQEVRAGGLGTIAVFIATLFVVINLLKIFLG